MVNHRRRNGLIIYKRYHAEFAGAAVGSFYDRDCEWLCQLGIFTISESHEERQRAYLIRRQDSVNKTNYGKTSASAASQKIIEQFEQ